MADAHQLIDHIRHDLKPLDDRILRHPYLEALEAGRLERADLRAFAGQQYHIVTSDLRSIAHILARHGTLPSRAFLMNVLQGEAAALDALVAFARPLEMTDQALADVEPIPAAHAYGTYMAWLAIYASDAELAGALLVNFAAWGANCGRMSRALRDRYGFSEADTAFFDLFANLPPLEHDALAVIQGGLDRGVSPTLIHRAARMLQGYELMYWDAMLEGLSGH
jgi:pyrroloquinoline quinone (PQQ) biosynthesis protein C